MPSTPPARVKPLLRGVSHEVAAVAAVVGSLLLARGASSSRGSGRGCHIRGERNRALRNKRALPPTYLVGSGALHHPPV